MGQRGSPGRDRSGSGRGGGAGRPADRSRAADSGRPANSGRASGAPGGASGNRSGRPASAGAGRGRPTREAGGERRPARDPGGDRRPRRVEPALPDDVTPAELDRSIRAELASLAKLNAETVARHLVMAGRLLEEDPEAAYAHATFARERAGRVGAVREAAGLAAYRTGRYAEALAELRAARRISGDQGQLPVIADCERGLGRPEKALEIAAGDEARRLDAAGRAELRIVASGARRDLGQPDAAVLLLQGRDLDPAVPRPWSARLFYAYADALLDAGREAEATTWFGHAAAVDAEGDTDAAERLDQLLGVTFPADDGA